ncbi:MAG: 1-(5-phosphoribosyl)-5-[(5-phosphoribosylamino)methylideneamino]imidazole-4-carboxamide isomerase [Acidimicrobiales bacterium]|nr:1-(5-phosphoribosyl)-5-[(5-phosphoribosylamino)methylideneamino]imidazole-4-carboxamide isomerase [Acidimicrobiales bacterium]MDG2218899.1 1-(5-phosphoribosyl)-5-[(5-phosphoribosylamino)methylideneamino]imidazole-4-carboxamide isomerase [Acidimicrobiales bacterium]
MELFPAIDVRGGRCVRLLQGDYAQETVYGDDPVAQAVAFAEAGAGWIHVVDLDAARTGIPENRDVVAAIAEAVDVPIQTGGGIRSIEAASILFDAGVERVVIGTAALTDPDLVRTLARDHRVAVGLDAKSGEVTTDGWLVGSGRTVLDVARSFASAGVDAFIVTDISRDGTLEGPDVVGLIEMLGATQVDVVASGGVGTLVDLVTLAGIEVDGRRLAGVIAGKAIYEGHVAVAEAVALLRGGV